MDDERGVERRLAAILAADVVGYSRLMEADEAGTHARLKALRKEFIEPRIAEHRGRVVKLTGDGALVEFASVVDAVRCAVEVQRSIAEHNADLEPTQRIEFRVGINLGDVITDDDDIYGEGVNVAARLEGLAPPGGVCISDVVHQMIRGRLDLAFEDLGEQQVKNIAQPVHAWQWTGEVRSTGLPTSRVAKATVPPLPDKPSIAVLPFGNLSGDPKEERLADGITEDIITDLSRFRDLFVIARNSTFVYKDKPTDVRQIAHELGVQYVLEGSLQARDGHARITAQLVDATTGNHLWSERYDRPLDDVFAIQDEVTEQIAGTLGSYWGQVAQALRERARRKPPESLEAYELYLLGVEAKHRLTKEDTIKAVELLNKAITLDPDFARAHVALAWCHLNGAIYGWTDDPTGSMEKFAASARQAVALDSADAEAHLALGLALLYQYRQIESGNKEIERALFLGPSNADVHAIAAWGRSTKIGAAQAKEDIALVKRAMRLNPHYPEWYLIPLSLTAYHGHEYDEAIHAAKQMVNHTMETYLYLALSLAELGQDSEAVPYAGDLLRLDPDFSAERHINNDGLVDEAIIEHFLGSIEKAGLPLCATQEQLAKYPDMRRLPQCEAERAKS